MSEILERLRPLFYPQGIISIIYGPCSLTDCITGFSDASGIDPVGIEALINWHIDAGTTGAFVVCSTGEMFSLTPDEMVEVVENTIKAAEKIFAEIK